MSDIQFDPFGEQVAARASSVETSDALSRGLNRLGTGLFWLLVVVIVSARVALFDPNLADKSNQFATWISSMWNIVSV
jgi:hypothetical protein